MRQTLLLFLALVVCALAPARAQSGVDPGDIYVNAYLAVQAAEKAEQGGNFQSALKKLNFASKTLDRIAKDWPTWSPPMVQFRRQKTAESIVRVNDKMGKYGPGRMDPNDAPLEGSLPAADGEGPIIFEPNVGVPTLPGNSVASAGGSLPRTTSRRTTESEGGADPVQQLANRMKKLQDDLNAAREQADRAENEKRDLAQKLEASNKARTESERKQEALQKRADLIEAELMKAIADGKTEATKIKSMQTDVANSRKELRNLKAESEADAEYRRQLNERNKAHLEKIAKLNLQKDVNSPAKIQEIQQQLEKTKKERDDLASRLQTVTVQRDEALAQVAKLKDAQKQVDKLVSDNAALMAKLADAETAVTKFRTEGMEKDKEIAALRKEVGSVKEQLAAARKESADYQRQMADLQTKLEASGQQLAAAKAENAESAKERKRMQEENTILRGIVLRQQKAEAVRAATKKVVLAELAKLEVNSKTLMKQIDLLSQPVVKLTEKELKLFRSPELQVSESGISMLVPNKGDGEAENATAPVAKSTDAGMAVDPIVPTPPAAGGAPVVAPEPPKKDPSLDSANAKKPDTALPGSTGSEKKPATTETPGAPAPGESSGAGGEPKVPAELLSLAREGKEQFERGNYLEAEKTYRKMLAKSPNNLYTLSNLGVVLFRAQKYKQAEDAFRKAIAVAPGDGFSHATLGIVFYNEKKLDEAVTELTKAIAIDPKNPTAHNYLGITASEKGWQEAAQTELEMAVKLDPNYADACFNLAVVFATQTPPDKDNARKYYKLAVQLGAAPDGALEQLIK